MFSVIFEALPNKENWDDYFDNAKMLRPELEEIEGFVDNVRYKSLTCDGWILSLSNWRDEKSLVRWRTRRRHHEAQQKGRDEILIDYHLRVGQITADNQVPTGYTLTEQRLDETEVGEGKTVTLISATRPAEWKQTNNPYDCAEWLGLNPWAADSTSWDIFDAVLTPGDLILLISWKDAAAAQAYEDAAAPNDKARVRRVRIVRDYGKYDRREAPQYYADAKGGGTLHTQSTVTNSSDDGAPRPQAAVAGDFDGTGTLNGRAGASVFSIGGPDGRGGTAAGANPYELLSASLAACTAMTIRLQARRRKISLSHVEVAVSYHHGGDGSRNSFERSITLEGNLVNDERAQLMQAANMCPVGRTLGLSADIRTNNVSIGRAASYDDDLSELPIPNIDAD